MQHESKVLFVLFQHQIDTYISTTSNIMTLLDAQLTGSIRPVSHSLKRHDMLIQREIYVNYRLRMCINHRSK